MNALSNHATRVSTIVSIICLLYNGIDGSTLVDLVKDIEEFNAVLPKSGHRLKVKKVVSEHFNFSEAETEQSKAISISCSSSTEISEQEETEEVSHFVSVHYISYLLCFYCSRFIMLVSMYMLLLLNHTFIVVEKIDFYIQLLFIYLHKLLQFTMAWSQCTELYNSLS